MSLRLCDIKRLAKKLKKETGITHMQALDDVCRSLGFNNYRHYLNTPLGKAELLKERTK